MAVPLWTFRHPPLQDLPLHLATLRVVHDLNNPQYGFSEIYTVSLGRTQYILFYVLGHLLAFVTGVRAAGLILVSAYMIGTVLGTYWLLRALKQDGRASLLVIPCLYNGLVVLGLIPFLIAVPLMLCTWAAACLQRERPTRLHAVALAAFSVALFYSHIIPFVIGMFGVALFAPRTSARAFARFFVPLVPAVVAAAVWLLFTDSGHEVWRVTSTTGRDVWPLGTAIREIYSVGFDVYRDNADEVHFAEAAVIAAIVVAVFRLPAAKSAPRFLFLIPLFCVLLYFRAEGHNGYAAHIRDRFPVLAVFSAIPLLRMPRGWKGHAVTIAMVAVCLVTVESTFWHFEQFERVDVGDFEEALRHIPPKKNVVGLIFRPQSDYIQENPFLHYVSYYQMEKGGVVKHDFMDFPHWVVQVKPHHALLGLSPARAGWEWRPDRVSATEELAPAFDYVLTRGAGFYPPDDLFEHVWEGSRWGLWKHR